MYSLRVLMFTLVIMAGNKVFGFGFARRPSVHFPPDLGDRGGRGVVTGRGGVLADGVRAGDGTVGASDRYDDC